MKIQFIFAAPRKMPKFGEMGEKVSPPLGILYLAAYLRTKIPDLEISAVDGPRKGFDYTLAKIKEFNPDVLCVSYYTVSALGAYDIINEIKEFNPRIVIIAGGHHVTALPGEALKRSKVDIEVYCEGEITITEIIKAYLDKKDITKSDLSKIRGIGYLEGNQLKITPPRQFIEDLDSLPFPARDLIDMSEYRGWYVAKQTRRRE